MDTWGNLSNLWILCVYHLDQGIPVEYELDTFNTPHAGTTLCHPQNWLCWCNALFRSRCYIHIYILDTYWCNDNRRTNKRRTQRDARRFLYNILPLTLLQGFERVVQGLHVRGCWRPNINFIFWPHCYDRHVVSFLFSWFWDRLHRVFPRAPSVGCGFPYHIWSLAVWNSAGNCFGTQLNSII